MPNFQTIAAMAVNYDDKLRSGNRLYQHKSRLGLLNWSCRITLPLLLNLNWQMSFATMV
jgi:hypothetical protein